MDTPLVVIFISDAPFRFCGLQQLQFWHFDAVDESGRPFHYVHNGSCRTAPHLLQIPFL